MNPFAQYFHGFNLIQGFGLASFQKILSFFNSPEEAWWASPSQLQKAGLSSVLSFKIKQAQKDIDLNKEIKKIKKENIQLSTIFDSTYPRLLKEIPDPPPLLYFKGQFLPKDNLALAVVGTRQASTYGKKATLTLIPDIAQEKLTIVSGLARGIDTLAHQTALKNNYRTIAVLGSGLNHVYPAENKKLAQSICQQGALISEFPPDQKPQPYQFPQRNRLISGLSLGVLIIESPAKGGSLITAQYALEYNREVFALPGSLFEKNTAGNHKLIQDGAKLVTCRQDILEEIPYLKTLQKRKNMTV